MADNLFKTDDLTRRFPGFGALSEHLGTARAAVDRIAAIDEVAAGHDEYGDAYRNSSKPQLEYVQNLVGAVEHRVGVTGEAGTVAIKRLDRADEENIHHGNFGSHKE